MSDQFKADEAHLAWKASEVGSDPHQIMRDNNGWINLVREASTQEIYHYMFEDGSQVIMREHMTDTGQWTGGVSMSVTKPRK